MVETDSSNGSTTEHCWVPQPRWWCLWEIKFKKCQNAASSSPAAGADTTKEQTSTFELVEKSMLEWVYPGGLWSMDKIHYGTEEMWEEEEAGTEWLQPTSSSSHTSQGVAGREAGNRCLNWTWKHKGTGKSDVLTFVFFSHHSNLF